MLMILRKNSYLITNCDYLYTNSKTLIFYRTITIIEERKKMREKKK